MKLKMGASRRACRPRRAVFTVFAKPNGKRGTDCHTQKQHTRREGPACPSVYLQMWRRMKKGTTHGSLRTDF